MYVVAIFGADVKNKPTITPRINPNIIFVTKLIFFLLIEENPPNFCVYIWIH